MRWRWSRRRSRSSRDADLGGLRDAHAARAILAADRYAREHPCARILADNAASSALLWHDPALAGRVVLDARLEQYATRALERWTAFQSADTTALLSTARSYPVLAGSTRYNPALVRRLTHQAGFTVLSRDANGAAVLSGARCAS